MIAVMVGPQATGTRFLFHADLVSQHSDFFQARPEEGWKEAEERIVRLPDLPDDTANSFDDFLCFLYTGKVYSVVIDEENEPGEDCEWLRLIDAWILGEVLLSVSFKDAVLDAIVHRLSAKSSSPVQLYISAYRYSSSSSPIRRLMVDIAVYRWEESSMSLPVDEEDRVGVFPFFQSVSLALLRWKLQSEVATKAEDMDPTRREGTCFYHEHGDKPCYRTMF
jgi:hypothetical protein